ncbi:unnamed protein product [Rangifer tarandus platyrhynchus]|uniref:Uncharacterized protein n=2 Tax=Rangifer tarandus platyrhynchus TaxID=3082113 RepID=A0AC59ZM21_RANTA|nr:unnamed protein product [Rangifer tarandus platyrhynchus]
MALKKVRIPALEEKKKFKINMFPQEVVPFLASGGLLLDEPRGYFYICSLVGRHLPPASVVSGLQPGGERGPKGREGEEKGGKGREGRDQDTGQLGFAATSFSFTAQIRDLPRNSVTVLEPCSSNSAYLKCDIPSREGGTAV